MLENLSSSQVTALADYRQRWLDIGLSTASADRVAARAGVDLAYQAAGLTPPTMVLWLDSPMAGAIGAAMLAQVRDQVGDQVGRAGYGQHDANWLGFYEFFQIAGGMGCVNPLQGLMAIAKSCGWWWPFQGAVILTERPCSLHRDERNLLHHPSEMAIRYPDGWGIYAWHGTRIPARYYEVKPTAQEILVEPNAEVRRALIERMGQDRFILDCNPNVLDEAPQKGSDVPNQLLAIDLPDDPDRRMVALKLSCPSTGACYILRVPPDQNKVKEALAWTFDVPEYVPVAEA